LSTWLCLILTAGHRLCILGDGYVRARHRNQRRSRTTLESRAVATLSAREARRVSQQASEVLGDPVVRPSGARQDGIPQPSASPQPGVALVSLWLQNCSLFPSQRLRPQVAMPLSATSSLKSLPSSGVSPPMSSVPSSRTSPVCSRSSARRNSTSAVTSRSGFLHQLPPAFTLVMMRNGRPRSG
jgi:hypothetical protein